MSTLRSLRERKGLTVSQLAGKSSIPSRVIADYEDGKQMITLAHAKLLAKALWVGIEDLMPPAGATPIASGQPPSAQAQPPIQRPAPAQSAPAQSAPAAPPRPAQLPPQPSYATGPASGQSQGYRQDRHDYSGAPAPRTDAPRPPRPAGYDSRNGGGSGGSGPHRGGPGAAGGTREARGVRPPPPPPSAISEGQVQELERLASKLEIEIEQLEERIGKKVAELTRPEAKDWIKRIRAMAEELAPSKKSPYGQWPGGHMDQEAAYLSEQKEAGAYFRFKLFNGEEIGGVITDFTPYTITVGSNGSSDDTVLRKLAIAYYRRSDLPAAAPVAPVAPVAPKRTRASKAQTAQATPPHDHERDNHHQPLDTGLDSDRPDEPQAPEADNMDEDRGL